ncbi:MAG: glycosyltransferase [Thermodesulfobacteriota bacterium]
MPDKTSAGFSIICVFNDRKKLSRYLIQSLKLQKTRYELIAIDNRQNIFPCAATVLNETAARARYDLLMFVHQDVALLSDTWLTDAQNNIESLDNFGGAGVAGNGPQGVVAGIFHGTPPKPVGRVRITKPMPVQTVDGCLLIVPKNLFLGTGFDERTCPGWYLYVANFCLDMARQGRHIYVLPREVYHESTGPGNSRVLDETRKNIIQKHRDHVGMIYTTMGEWSTGTKPGNS